MGDPAEVLPTVDLPMSVVARTAEIDALLSRDGVVAIGVSGGKDSDACALATAAYLDQVGHRGPGC